MMHLLSMMLVVITGVLVLMLGILCVREEKQSLVSAIKESLIWGSGLLISLGTEVCFLMQI